MLLAIVLAPVCCYWAQDQAVDRIFSLMVPPVALTLALIIANVPLRVYARRFALTEADLIVFYAMQAVMCAMASEWMDVIAPYVSTYGLFADRNARYRSKILPYVSDWLFFKDRTQLTDFAAGGKPTWYFLSHLDIWWPKIVAWTLIAGLVCLAMLCINSLMREQWCNNEKLAFPIIQLPIAMVQGGGASPFWRSRYMWGAFAVMFGIDMLNGLAFLYPALPRVNVRFLGDMVQWFNTPPWNQVGWTPIGIFPYMAAIGLFMPTDLLFSCVFFFFVRKGQQVAAAAMGYEQGVFGGGGLVPAAPYFSEQSWGAFLGLFVTAVWVARGYLRGVWHEIVRGGPRDARLVPHRFAFGGLVLSLGGLGWIGMVIGLPFLFVLAYVVVFLAFSVALTRLRAQLGPPTHEMAFMGPNQLLVDLRGTQGVGVSMVSRAVTAFHFMNRIHRTHPMPTQLEGIKMAERSRMSQRGMFAAILLATVLGSVLGHLVRIYLGYRWTPGDVGGDTADVVAQLTDTPRAPNVGAVAAIAGSFAFVMLLDFIRFRVPGFVLHPAGYALAMNFGVDYYWFGLMIVLVVKVFVQRYYGLKGYERLRMVAFGILLGEFAAEGIWGTMAMITREATYSISINGRLGWNQ
ncbi:MAG: hypothetical protein IT208_03875 [Chthonomonadales bacterium]|nr:hypothetical protein [Chthonomonadales bacterium]